MKKRINVCLVLILIIVCNFTYITHARVLGVGKPAIKMVTQPAAQYKTGDKVKFVVTSNYTGKVEYRVILWNGTTKKTSELWSKSPGYYYKGWQPRGNEKFTIQWPVTGMESGAYSLTVLVRRVGAKVSYDSYVKTNAFWIAKSENEKPISEKDFLNEIVKATGINTNLLDGEEIFNNIGTSPITRAKASGILYSLAYIIPGFENKYMWKECEVSCGTKETKFVASEDYYINKDKNSAVSWFEPYKNLALYQMNVLKRTYGDGHIDYVYDWNTFVGDAADKLDKEYADKYKDSNGERTYMSSPIFNAEFHTRLKNVPRKMPYDVMRFGQIYKDFAQVPTDYKLAVMQVADLGLMNGYWSDTSYDLYFKPNNYLTIAEADQIVDRLINEGKREVDDEVKLFNVKRNDEFDTLSPVIRSSDLRYIYITKTLLKTIATSERDYMFFTLYPESVKTFGTYFYTRNSELFVPFGNKEVVRDVLGTELCENQRESLTSIVPKAYRTNLVNDLILIVNDNKKGINTTIQRRYGNIKVNLHSGDNSYIEFIS